jgi:phosphocarrier protein
MNSSEFLVTLASQNGLHARPAGLLAKLASQFQSKVEFIANGNTKNGKSIMSLMSLGLKGGESILIKAEGDDAVQAIDAIKKLFESQFKE